MIAQTPGLAIVLAITLNHANRFVRAGGTLLVAIGLAFIVLSIYPADTGERLPPRAQGGSVRNPSMRRPSWRWRRLPRSRAAC